MMRLFRIGKKNQPSFKIVVTDKKNPPHAGRFVEEVGAYNPLTKNKVLNKERIQYWLERGVQPSPTVHNLLVKEGILAGKKIPKHKKSKSAQGGSASGGKPPETPKPAEEKTIEAKPQSPSEAKPSEGKDEAELHRIKAEEPKKE